MEAIEASARLRKSILSIDSAIPTKAVARQLGISPTYDRKILRMTNEPVA
jgi:hypothetical protein